MSNLNNRRERRNRKDSSFRWRFRGNVRDGVFIITPSGNDWTEVDDVQVALKLISILNFHDDIIDAIKSGDWDVIDRVMAAYKRDSD